MSKLTGIEDKFLPSGSLTASRSHYNNLYLEWSSPAENSHSFDYGFNWPGFFTPHDGGDIQMGSSRLIQIIGVIDPDTSVCRWDVLETDGEEENEWAFITSVDSFLPEDVVKAAFLAKKKNAVELAKFSKEQRAELGRRAINFFRSWGQGAGDDLFVWDSA